METWVENLKEPYRNNRYEVFFNTADLTQELKDCLRLSCNSVETLTDKIIKLTFYDFEGNKEYNALDRFVQTSRKYPTDISIVCYNGAHEKYETITIVGKKWSTGAVIDFNWSSENTARNLVMYINDYEISVIRH